MAVIRNHRETIDRVVGDVEPVAAVLYDQDRARIDVTGLTFKFRLVNTADGSLKVEGDAVVVSIDGGTGLSYTFAAADVDTVGVYAMYFVDQAAPQRRYPFDGPNWLLNVIAEGG